MADVLIHAGKMKTIFGDPVPTGQIVEFTTTDLHKHYDGYHSVGRLVKTPRDSEVVVEYMRFRHALGEVYFRSPVMETIRREDRREFEERRHHPNGLATYNQDPSKKVFLYCKTKEDAMRLYTLFGRLGEKVAIQAHEPVPEWHTFMEALAPTYMQTKLFAESLEAELNKK